MPDTADSMPLLTELAAHPDTPIALEAARALALIDHLQSEVSWLKGTPDVDTHTSQHVYDHATEDKY